MSAASLPPGESPRWNISGGFLLENRFSHSNGGVGGTRRSIAESVDTLNVRPLPWLTALLGGKPSPPRIGEGKKLSAA